MVEKRFGKLGMPDIERFENYLPTAFSSELTLLQKVNKIIQDLIETNKLTNEMVDYLNNFVETFDEKLYETTGDILSVWLEDGVLSELIRETINDEVIEARSGKPNLKTRIDDLENETNTQLTHITTLIYPEMSQSDIQEKLSEGGHFKFLGGVHYVDLLFKDVDGYDCAYILHSNTTIEFAEGISMELKNHNSKSYKMFALTDIENVELKNITLNGSRDKNSASGGSWGMGLSLKGTTNVNLENIKTENLWGDGLYIGISTNQKFCKDTNVVGFKADNNRRQGISIVSVINLTMRNLDLRNTNGALPSDGIDIEPNNNDEYLQNILIENVYTENNVGSGIKVFMGRYKESENPISITIKNHVDKNSDYGFRAREYLKGVKGFVKLENCEWENGDKNSFIVQDWASTGPRIEAYDCTSIWTGNAGSDISGFRIGNSLGATASNILGNVHLYRPNLIVKNGSTAPYLGMSISSANSATMENISIIDPISLPTSSEEILIYIGSPMKNLLVTDRYKILSKSSTKYTTVSSYKCKRSYDNEGASNLVSFELIKNMVGQTITFTNKVGTKLEIIPPKGSGKMIFPITTAETSIYSEQKGSSLTLVGVDDGFLITEMVGEWLVK